MFLIFLIFFIHFFLVLIFFIFFAFVRVEFSFLYFHKIANFSRHDTHHPNQHPTTVRKEKGRITKNGGEPPLKKLVAEGNNHPKKEEERTQHQTPPNEPPNREPTHPPTSHPQPTQHSTRLKKPTPVVGSVFGWAKKKNRPRPKKKTDPDQTKKRPDQKKKPTQPKTDPTTHPTPQHPTQLSFFWNLPSLNEWQI